MLGLPNTPVLAALAAGVIFGLTVGYAVFSGAGPAVPATLCPNVPEWEPTHDAASTETKVSPATPKQPSQPAAPPLVNLLTAEQRCDRCKALLERVRAAGMNGKPISPVWVHFPKCGSSFATVMHQYGCQADPNSNSTNSTPLTQLQLRQFIQSTWNSNEKCPCGVPSRWDQTVRQLIDWRHNQCRTDADISTSHFQNHLTFWKKNFDTFERRLVGMFRDPRRRLLSAYNDQKHSFGLPSSYRPQLIAANNLEEYINVPGIKSCMTKMILGEYCARVEPISPSMLVEAVRRVTSSFAFVGLVEEWDASVCLFHAMNGGEPGVVEYQNSRSYSYRYEAAGLPMAAKNRPRAGNATFAAADDWKKLSEKTDPDDWQVYQAVRKRFYHELSSYGLASLLSHPEQF
eukprot:m.93415 g.93415  ORF g.93415 m.93415 type:complete len:402 (-) comp15092_c0_seq1:172-1377(-)